ncbi:MAG: EamA family transporter [Clostridiales bacterium]|nr:EamA family transporter [Clostridiales bacterium]
MNNFFKKFPSVSILIAGALWGSTGIFVRRINAAGLDSFQLIFFRSIITAVCMSAFLLIKDRQQMKINPRDWWYFFGTGILSFLLFTVCYFYTINKASMSVAAILLYTAPFFVMIMSSIFFGEKITAAKILALIMAAVGCIMICGTEHNTVLTPSVILIGIASGFCYALYSIFGRVALKKYSSAAVTAYTFIFSSIGSLFVVDFNQIHSVAVQKPDIIALTVVFSVLSAVLPYIFYTNGLKYVESGKASIMATIEVVVASLIGLIAFHETISIAAFFGIMLVLSAVAVLNVKKSV